MQRPLLFGLTLASLVASTLIMFEHQDASAQRARRTRGRRGHAAAPAEAPRSEAIEPALGDMRWGMTPAETFNVLRTQVEGAYRERLQKASRVDAILEDRLRNQQTEDLRRIRSSFVRFRGQASGWDTSFIRDEFTHNNNESMMLWRDESSHSQRYYFFINDRLWKLYQAFDASVFPGATFDQFSDSIQGRFGRGVERSGALVEGRTPTQWVEWQDQTTRLRAIDQTRFFGFFCLVFEDKATLSRLPQLRSNTLNRGSEGHAVVDSVLRAGEVNDDGRDDHADIADRMTGNIRRRSDAEGGPTSVESSGARSAPSGSSTSAPSSGGAPAGRQSDPDDPFAGMSL